MINNHFICDIYQVSATNRSKCDIRIGGSLLRADRIVWRYGKFMANIASTGRLFLWLQSTGRHADLYVDENL